MSSAPDDRGTPQPSTWLEHARSPAVVKRALKAGLVVGTILVTINHFDALARGDVSLLRAGKILLTYCVPYCVATYASVSALLDQQRTHASGLPNDA